MEAVDFQTRLTEYMAMTESYLSNCLRERPCRQKNVLQAMKYSVEAGGKRIRPVLTLEFCRLCGGSPEQALPFAAAVEMIHSYSLIHDDLPCMDNDDYRRGKPSCHKAFGEANALLAGDGLLTMAFETLTKAELPPDCIVKAVNTLAGYAGVMGMIGGQVIDLENEGKEIDKETLKLTYDLKTAALLQSACVLGCIAAEASAQQIKAAEQYAKSLGFAFQIMDDILDVEGEATALGKPVGSDVANNKRTYTALYGIQQAKDDARRYSEEAMDALREFSDHQFLIQLTQSLAERNH